MVMKKIVLENQAEYDLYNEVTPILFPLLRAEAVEIAFSEMDDGGYPAGAVAYSFSALNVPVPRSAIEITAKYQDDLDAYNNDWFGVDRAMWRAIDRNGINEDA